MTRRDYFDFTRHELVPTLGRRYFALYPPVNDRKIPQKILSPTHFIMSLNLKSITDNTYFFSDITTRVVTFFEENKFVWKRK